MRPGLGVWRPILQRFNTPLSHYSVALLTCRNSSSPRGRGLIRAALSTCGRAKSKFLSVRTAHPQNKLRQKRFDLISVNDGQHYDAYETHLPFWRHPTKYRRRFGWPVANCKVQGVGIVINKGVNQ